MTEALKDTPLDDAIARTLGAIGARLHEHLKAIVECLPNDQRTAKGLTTRFNLEGVVARRLVRAIASEPGLVTLTRMPSPEHVRNFVNLVEFDTVHLEACAGVVRALDELKDTTADLGGGRARLTKRIRATLAAEKAG